MRKTRELSFSVSDLSSESIANLRKSLELLKAQLAKGQTARIRVGKGKEIILPESLINMFSQALTKAADGKKVVIIEEDEEVSTEEAAEFLRVSRPFLIKQLEAGEIPFHKVGTHRRILMADILEYKRTRRARTQEILRQMREEAEDLGLYD